MVAFKKNLHKAQHQMKQFTDKKIVKWVFEVWDLVFLKLQSYKQNFMAMT